MLEMEQNENETKVEEKRPMFGMSPSNYKARNVPAGSYSGRIGNVLNSTMTL